MNRLNVAIAPPIRFGLVILTFLAVAFAAWGPINAPAWWSLASGWSNNGILSFVLGLVAFLLGVGVVLASAGGAAWILDKAAFSRTYVALVGLAVAGTFFAVMAGGIGATEAWNNEAEPQGDDFDALAEGLFTTHVIALEVLGILLTAAMIGAMVIARPLGGRPDAINYPTKQARSDLDAIQSISDVDRNLGAGGFALDAAVPDIEEQEGVDAWPEEKVVPPPEPQAKAAPAPSADSEEEEAPAKSKGGSEE